jgi:hypothetical protein
VTSDRSAMTNVHSLTLVATGVTECVKTAVGAALCRDGNLNVVIRGVNPLLQSSISQSTVLFIPWKPQPKGCPLRCNGDSSRRDRLRPVHNGSAFLTVVDDTEVVPPMRLGIRKIVADVLDPDRY